MLIEQQRHYHHCSFTQNISILLGVTFFFYLFSSMPLAYAQDVIDPTPKNLSPTQSLTHATDQKTQELAFSIADWLHLAEGQGTAEEYLDFLQHNPQWPLRRQFSMRLQNALVNESNITSLRHVCTTWPLTQAAAFLTCFTRLPPDTQLMQFLLPKAVDAWENGNDNPEDAKTLLRTFSSILSPQSTYKRFLREEKTQHYDAALNTMTLLPAQDQTIPRADIALRRNTDDAQSLYLSLNQEQKHTSLLNLHYATWLRKHRNYQQALNLWKETVNEDEKKNYSNEYWSERNALARLFITAKDGKDAYLMASDPYARGEARLDSLFLSGWIALRMLHDTKLADASFLPLTQSSSLITQARGYYWLGCVQLAKHQDTQAKIYWMRAALFPSTFYGQIASSRLENFHNFLSTPNNIPLITSELIKNAKKLNTTNLQNSDLPLFEQIAQILYATGHEHHVRAFLAPQTFSHLDQSHRTSLANFSLQVGSPDIAVALARQGTRDGYFLFPQGWPHPYPLPHTFLPYGLLNSLIRQESSYNPQSVSYSNAIGLMQMKPATALDMQRLLQRNGEHLRAPNLYDPQSSMKLGQLYLEQIAKQFNNNIPLTAAAYNAGPHRVTTWFNENGNPNTTKNMSIDKMVDWIELIPDSQTRNYVERVWENMITYHILEQSCAN